MHKSFALRFHDYGQNLQSAHKLVQIMAKWAMFQIPEALQKLSEIFFEFDFWESISSMGI